MFLSSETQNLVTVDGKGVLKVSYIFAGDKFNQDSTFSQGAKTILMLEG